MKNIILSLVREHTPHKYMGLPRPKFSSAEILFRILLNCGAKSTEGAPLAGKENFSPIYRELNKMKINGSALGNGWWRLLRLCWADYDKLDEHLDELINVTVEKDYNTLSTFGWLHLYALAIRMSLFTLAYHIRDKAFERAINDFDPKNCSLFDFERFLGASVEQADVKSIEKHLNHYKKRFFWREKQRWTARAFSVFLDIWNDKMEPEDILNTHQDRSFLEYIRGKEIALVGPADLKLGLANEIDSYDKVARFNYREKGLGCDPVHNGQRVDITLFSNLQAEYLAKSVAKLDIDLDWAVIKSESKFNYFTENVSCPGVKLRYGQYYNDLIFNGAFNAVPQAVIDFLIFSPKKIKIFNADLMITEKRYNNYNVEELTQMDGNDGPDYFSVDSATHDPIAQYNFLRVLWEKDLIDGDPRFNEVMEMGLKSYMEKLDQIFGLRSLIQERGVEIPKFDK